MAEITNQIDKAIALLNNNEIIAIPTETVYGLAGNIYSDSAIKKIFELKKRPFFNPLIVHIKSIEALKDVALDIPPIAYKVAELFWPGPITMVLKKQPSISDLITAGKNTVAVRVPKHPVTLSLLNQLEFPLAAPSANPFGSISPTTANHVDAYFKKDLELILDGGACTVGIESTIIGFENNRAIVYRQGSISQDEIESKIGKVKLITVDEKAPVAPGMLLKHYAPKTTTLLVTDVRASIAQNPHKKIGLLLFKDAINDRTVMCQEVLSKSGELNEAASNLYSALHRLDDCHLDLIIAEYFPDTGLGRSINDKLKRAAAV
jgi:L-threonylcarbamoyladenylate synthase